MSRVHRTLYNISISLASDIHVYIPVGTKSMTQYTSLSLSISSSCMYLYIIWEANRLSNKLKIWTENASDLITLDELDEQILVLCM